MNDIKPASPCGDPYCPRPAKVTERIVENQKVVTLRFQFLEHENASYAFLPGQFNMLHGPDGGVPISIVAGNDKGYYEHCIRGAGNATRALADLRPGDIIGLRGPFGKGVWPVEIVKGKDIIFISGGIGSAALASAIDHVLANRHDYGNASILQGINTQVDHMYAQRYLEWASSPNTSVLLSAMDPGPEWKGMKGLVTDLLCEERGFCMGNSAAMVCGPEPMVRPVVAKLMAMGLAASDIFVSMERNMQCGIGQCAHCQIGSRLVCRDGPVFSWDVLGPMLDLAP